MRFRRRSELPVTAPDTLRLVALSVLVAIGIGCEESTSGSCEPPASNGATSDTPSPTVELPPDGTGGPFLQGTTFDPASVGYVQSELFFSGEALAVASTEPLTDDGRWATGYSSTAAAYRSRMVVMRPIDPADFSGTVFVEWLNVSGGLDAAPDWGTGHVEMLRRGHAWVGVSAQLVGVEGGGGIIPGLDLGLKIVNAARYGTLTHPGDSFSYDMFGQAGMAVRAPTGIDPLGGLVPERVIATGESQSAMRLVTYVNGVDRLANVFDAFLIHSRLGGSAPLSQDPQTAIDAPSGTQIRDDARVPVLVVQTETDLIALGSIAARRDDGPGYRLWEIPGTGHADLYTLLLGAADTGGDVNTARVIENAEPIPGIFTCDEPVNANPAHHFVYKAAVRAMNEWIECGTAPPAADRVSTSGDVPAIDVDAAGNALGGIRTPWMDAATALHTGDGQGGLCFLFGTSHLFDDEELVALHGDVASYQEAALASLDRALEDGFILDEDAPIIEQAILEASFGVAP